MAKLTIDLSGTGGLSQRNWGQHPFSSTKPELQYVGRDNQYADGVVNPMAVLGYMSPANNTTRAVTVASSQPNSLISSYAVAWGADSVYTGEYDLNASNSSRILKLTSRTDVEFDVVRTVLDGDARKPIITDMAMYLVNDSFRMFYSWRSKSSGATSNMGMYDFSSWDDTYLSATASGGGTLKRADHRLVVADDGFMYIIDGGKVHRLDGRATGGTDGTATMSVLKFLGITTGFAIDAIDLRGRMWIAVHGVGPHMYSGGAVNPNDFSAELQNLDTLGVYIWDRLVTVANMQDFIPIPGIKEIKTIHNFRGVPLCFTISSTGYTQIRVWNGSTFSVVKTLEKNAYPRFHSSVIEGDLGITWQGFDGLIRYYGKLDEELEDGLYKIGDMTGHVTTSTTLDGAGALVPWGGTETVASGYNTLPIAFYTSLSDDGPNFLLKKWYPHAYDPNSTDQKAHTNTVYSMVKFLPKLSNVQGITLRYPAVGSGGSTTLLSVDIFVNQSSTSSKTQALTQKDAQRGWKWISFATKNVNSMQLGLSWAAENLADNIMPYAATVDYTVVEKKK